MIFFPLRHRKSMSAVLCFLLAVSVAKADIIRLGNAVVPTAQSITLVVDADRPDYTGTVKISLDVSEPVTSFRLHSRDNDIRELALNGPLGQVPVSFEYSEDDGLIITADHKLETGRHTLSMMFISPFNTQADALYRLDVDGFGYSFTQFEADAAREAFPCFDEPRFKIPFTLTLIIPKEHRAVANTPVESVTTQDNWTTVTFATTKPLPSYLIALATGPLEVIEIPGMSTPGRVVTVKGRTDLAGLAIEYTPPILAALEEYFGGPYPFEKLDLIAVPEFWAGAMENPGAVTFRETLLLSDPATTSVGQRRGLASTMAHELAHMWFGDVVTMEWWDDLWLNESFAEWMAYKITNQLYPEYGMAMSTVRRTSGVMEGDARPSAIAVRQPVTNTDYLLQNVGAIYGKGLAVLNMFEQLIGEETFRTGVNNYIETHRWENATADDLWKALDEVTDVSIQSALETYILQPGVPLVSVKRLSDGSIEVAQQRFANYGVTYSESQKWEIPITLKYSDGNQTRSFSFVMTDSVQTVTLQSDGRVQWIFPHAEAAGYYRWIVPSDMLLTLAQESRTLLSVPERISYLLNLGALLDAGAVSGGDYLKAIDLFARDTDPDVTRAILTSLGNVRQSLVPEDLEDQFARYVRHTLTPAFEIVGAEPRPDDNEVVSLLRPDLIEWMGQYGQSIRVMALAKEKATAYLTEPASVDQSLAGTYLSMAALEGDAVMWEEFRLRFESAEIPRERSRYLYLLGGFRDTVLARRALDYVFEGPLRPQEILSIPQAVWSATGDGARVFDWLMTNYDTIIDRIPPPYHAYLPYFAGGCSTERFDQAKKFFSDPEFHKQGMETALSRVGDQVSDCVELRERESQSVRDYLQSILAR